MSNANVLLADGSPVIRLGLKQIVQRIHTHFHFWEATHDNEVSASIEDNGIGLLLINTQLPSLSSTSFREKVLLKFPGLKIIALTMSEKCPWEWSLSGSGACGIVSLNSSQHEIEGAIRTVLVGDRYIANLEEPSAFSRKATFNPLEKQLVGLLAKGKTSKEISIMLDRTVKTVETYRSRLFKKAGVKNTSELISFFYRENLFQKIPDPGAYPLSASQQKHHRLTVEG